MGVDGEWRDGSWHPEDGPQLSALAKAAWSLALLVGFAVSGLLVISAALYFLFLGPSPDEPTPFRHAACRSSEDALIVAATAGDPSLVASLLDGDRDPNATDEAGNTALACAGPLGNSRVVRVLLDAGANPNTVARDGDSVLSDAARFCQVPVARKLLDAGADPNSVDDDGVTALQQAVDHGVEDLAEILLERGADATAIDLRGGAYGFGQEEGPMCPITRRVEPELVILLLAHDADPTLLLGQGVELESLPIARLCLDAGADPNAGFEAVLLGIEDDVDALALAALLGAGPQQESLVALLGVESSDVSRYLVHNLYYAEHPEEHPRARLDSHASITTDEWVTLPAIPLPHDSSGLARPPILVAAWNGHPAMVRLLLDAGADPNAQAAGGYTALHAAAVAGHDDITALLVEAGAVAPEGVIAPDALAALAGTTPATPATTSTPIPTAIPIPP